MAKVVGVCKVLSSEYQEFVDKQTGEVKGMFRVTALGDDKAAYCFYRPVEEDAKEGDQYQFILSPDNKLKPVIKFQKEK